MFRVAPITPNLNTNIWWHLIYVSLKIRVVVSSLWNIHCIFEKSISAPKCQNSPKAPGADGANCGATSVTAGTKRPPSETEKVHSGTQFHAIWPFGAGPHPVSRTIVALNRRAKLAPKIVLMCILITETAPFWGLKQNVLVYGNIIS